MRPRLPLCLLPFVGVLAFASSFSSSHAANITIENGKISTNINQYYAYAFNGISAANRDSWHINRDNFLLDLNNTFTFKVNTYDGIIHHHVGGGTDLAFQNAVTLYAGSDPAAWGGLSGQTIQLNGTNLTFNSTWGAQYPICPFEYLADFDGGFDDPLRIITRQWTYATTMGIKGNGDLTFNFQTTTLNHEFFLISSSPTNSGEPIFATHIKDSAGDPLMILKGSAATPQLSQDQAADPANITINGNVSVLGGDVIYHDARGTFQTGNKTAKDENQFVLKVAGNRSTISIQEASIVDIYSKILVTDQAALYFDKGVTTLRSGFTVSKGGVLELNVNNFQVEASDKEVAQAIDGGKVYINGSYFNFQSDIMVYGAGEGNSPASVRSSLFEVTTNSVEGVFYGKVTVESLGTLALYGEGTIFKNSVTIQNNGAIILGGAGDNTITMEKGLTLAEGARVEANTNGTTSIMVNGKESGIDFQGNGAFAVFRGVGGTSTVYDGGFSVKKDKTITIRHSLTQSPDLSYRGDYIIGTRNGSGIIGEGNINIQMGYYDQCIGLDSKNTYTGSTTITRGILVLTNETLDGNGNITSSSAGAGNRPIIISNDSDLTGVVNNPMLALDADYVSSGTTDKVLHKNIQIGSTFGNAYFTFISGDFSVLNADGTGRATRSFADNVIFKGSITDAGDSKGIYHFIKQGTGSLTFAGNGKDANGNANPVQANYNGITHLQQGALILGNADGVASLKNDASNFIYFDGVTPQADIINGTIPTLVIKRMDSAFNNNIAVITHGRIDVTEWSDNLNTEVVLSGIIGDDATPVNGRLLEIYSTNNQEHVHQGVTLSGTINLTDGTLKFYGNQLTISGQVGGTTTLDLSGKENKYNTDSTYGPANIVFNPSKNDTYFGSDLIGAKDMIKTGSNTLILGSDMSDGTAYEGNVYIKEGTLKMDVTGKLSNKGTVYLEKSGSTVGTLDLYYSEQNVAGLIGNGILNTNQAGILAVHNGHGTGENEYFGGNITGTGILMFDYTGDKSIFRLGNVNEDTSTRPENWAIDFSGLYAVKGGGILSAESKDILSHKATVGLFGNSTLKLVSEAGNQRILALYSLKDKYETDLESQASILLGKQSSLSIQMGAYSGSILQEEEMDPYATAIEKIGAVNGDGEPLAVDAKENTLILIGNGNANQYNFKGGINVGSEDTLAAGGTLVLQGTNLSNIGTVTVSGSAKPLTYRGGAVTSQIIVDLNNNDVSINDIVLKNGAGLRTTGGASGHSFNVKNMKLDGSSLIVEAALDANHQASLQGFNVNGEVTISKTEKNYIDLDLAAGNWGYNADANNGSGNTMKVFTTSQESNLDNLLVKESKYVFLNQNRDIVNNKEIYIDVTRNGVKFSDFINGSIGASLDYADNEYVSTNKLKGQSAGTLGLVLDQMYVMTSKDQVAKAVQSLSGASSYVLPTAQLMDLRQHADTVRDRISRIGVTPGTNMTEEVYHGWAMGLTNATDIKGDGQVPGFKKDTWGGMIGFDTDVSNDLSWGMAFAYTSSDLDIDGGDSATTEAYYLDGFGRYQKDKWSVTGVATVGTTTSDTKRRMTIGELDGIAKGSPNGYFLNALAEVGYDIDLPNNWIIQPLVNLNLGYLNVDSYSETGMGNAALSVDSTGQFIARLGAGVRSIYSFYEDAWSQKANLQLRAMVLQDLTDVSPSVSQSLIGSIGSFDADGSGMGKTAFQLGAGVTVPVAFNLSVFANVDAEFRSDANSIGGNLGVRYTF